MLSKNITVVFVYALQKTNILVYSLNYAHQLRLPDGRYFTANLAEAGKKPVF